MNEKFMNVCVALITASALWDFIKFLIQRKDNKQATNKVLKENIEKVSDKVDRLNHKVDENSAVLARTHILRFSDELKNGIKHSDEYFRQQLMDCDTYDRFCESNPEFKNGYTEIASTYIKETYKRLLKEHKI